MTSKMIGVQVLSMGGLLSSVFAIPTPPIIDPRDQESLLEEIKETPQGFIQNSKFIFDNHSFGNLNKYVSTGVNLPATENDFNSKYDKDRFYMFMKGVLLKHGDFYALTRDAYISIHTNTTLFRGSVTSQMISYGQKLAQYAELASVIYTAVAQVLDEMQELQRGSPERLAKLKMLNDLLTGMAGVTMGMAQNSSTFHDAMVAFQAGTILDSSLISRSSALLLAASSDIDTTFTKMKRDVDNADKLVLQLETKICRGDKSEATYWEHYSAVLDSMMKTSGYAACWDTVASIKTIRGQSLEILQDIESALQQINSAVSSFARIAAIFSSMKNSFTSAAGDVDPNANPLMFSESVFKDTLMAAAQDWILVKCAASIFTEKTESQLQSLGL